MLDVLRFASSMMPPQAHIVDRIERPDSEVSSHPTAQQDNYQKIKCVLLGDGAVGKTSLVVSYTTNGYPTEYVPTAFDNYSVVVTVDNQPVRFQLCDTAGQDDFDKLRPLCYPNCHVFLLCFSVVTPASFQNVTQKWLPEIRRHCPTTPIILVGTQSDLRNDVNKLIELASYKESPVSEGLARSQASHMGAVDYVECSALTQKNLKEVFDLAIITAMDRTSSLYRSCKKRKSKSKRTKVPHKDKDQLADDCAVVRKGWKKLCCFL